MRAGKDMDPKVTRRFAAMLVGVTAVILNSAVAFAQQSNAPAAQPGTAPTQQGPAQLPDASSTADAQTALRPATTAETSSSSSQSAPARLYWSETNPNVQVTVLENTLLRVITDTPVSTEKAHEGQPLSFTLYEDVLVDNLLVIPRGATLHGVVVELKKPGKLTGSPDLILKLVSLEFEGRSYPVYSYEFKVEGTSKSAPTSAKVKAGTVIGALAAATFDATVKAPGTAAEKLAVVGAGAAVGAGVGTVAAAASRGPVIDLPAEAQIDFYLASPMSIVPVSRREAIRLSEGLYSGGPALYVRGETP